MPGRLGADQREALAAGETVWLESGYGDPPHRIDRQLIDVGRAIAVLDGTASAVDCPVRMLHGTDDESVPMSLSERLLETIGRDRASLERIEGGDHRLSNAAALARVDAALDALFQLDAAATAAAAARRSGQPPGIGR